QDNPDVVYNLGFGDWVDETGDVDDLAVSNNNDRKKVLSTEAVLAFTRKHKNAFIVAKGSTPSRTRLYQMGIAEFYDDIESLFHVSGRIGNQWLTFEKGKNYDAFLMGAIQIVAYILNGRVIAKLCWVVRVEAIFDQNRLLHSIAHFQRSGSQ